MLKVRRLRLLARLLEHGPALLKHMLAATLDFEKGISYAMHHDLHTLWVNVACVSDEMPDPLSDGVGQVWANMIASKTRMFKFWTTCHAPQEMSPLPSRSEPVDAPKHKCPFCSKLFSFQALGTHMFTAHGQKNEIRRLVVGSTCCACLKNHNTRSKLLHHLSFRSKKCKQYYQNVMPPLDEALYSELEAQTATARNALKKAGRSLLYDPSSVVQVPGPLPGPENFAAAPAVVMFQSSMSKQP